MGSSLRVLFHMTPECVVGVEPLGAEFAREGSRVLVEVRHVFPMDGSRLERGSADLAEEGAFRRVHRLMFCQDETAQR